MRKRVARLCAGVRWCTTGTSTLRARFVRSCASFHSCTQVAKAVGASQCGKAAAAPQPHRLSKPLNCPRRSTCRWQKVVRARLHGEPEAQEQAALVLRAVRLLAVRALVHRQELVRPHLHRSCARGRIYMPTHTKCIYVRIDPAWFDTCGARTHHVGLPAASVGDSRPVSDSAVQGLPCCMVPCKTARAHSSFSD